MVDDTADDVDTRSESAPTVEHRPTKEILGLDHVYEALGHPRRRYLCYSLLEDTQWSLTDLATKTAAWENDISEHAVTEHQREQVYVSLSHIHVPKLVEEGVIAFNDANETITLDENADQVLAALEGIGASLDSSRNTRTY